MDSFKAMTWFKSRFRIVSHIHMVFEEVNSERTQKTDSFPWTVRFYHLWFELCCSKRQNNSDPPPHFWTIYGSIIRSSGMARFCKFCKLWKKLPKIKA